MCDLSPEQMKLLEEAIRTAREMPVPAGPPESAIRTVLAEVAASFRPVQATTIQRIINMTHKRPLTIAAALVLVAGTLLIWTLMPGGASVAWADVVQRIMEVKSVTLDVVITDSEGGNKQNWKVMVLQPDRLRLETDSPVELTDLIDLKTGKGLVLVHKEKVAVPIEYGENLKAKNPAIQDWFGRIRNLLDQPHEELGTRQMGDKTTIGYEITKNDQTVIFWVDAQTAMPVSMEFTMMVGSTTVKATNWEFDRPLDAGLFEMSAPEGYTMQQPIDLGNASIDDVATVLRIWASARGGTFPDDLSPTRFSREFRAGQDVVTIPEPKDKQNVTQEQVQQDMSKALGRGFLFLAQHRNAVYTGKGVIQGEANTPIYWCKSPGKEATTYQVIYGDLSVREAAEAPVGPENGTGPEQ